MREDGGQAFPGMKPKAFGQDSGHVEGMTLRDYLAAKALQGILARHGMGGATDAARESKHAYIYADAMLKAREE